VTALHKGTLSVLDDMHWVGVGVLGHFRLGIQPPSRRYSGTNNTLFQSLLAFGLFQVVFGHVRTLGHVLGICGGLTAELRILTSTWVQCMNMNVDVCVCVFQPRAPKLLLY